MHIWRSLLSIEQSVLEFYSSSMCDEWLNKSYQRNTLLVNYLLNFNSKICEAEDQNWNDIIKINFLNQYINFELFKLCISHFIFMHYYNYCSQLYQLDNNLTHFNAVQKSCNNYKQNFMLIITSTASTASADAINWIFMWVQNNQEFLISLNEKLLSKSSEISAFTVINQNIL